MFSISHREVYDLFRAWGWIDGLERGDGHKRMVWQDNESGYAFTVQIMPPNRSGTGEQGNAKGIQKAAAVMKMPVQEFLEGPVGFQEEERQRRINMADRRAKRVEKAVYQKAAEAAQQEVAMPKGQPVFKGVTQLVANYMSAHPGQTVSNDDILAGIQSLPGCEGIDRAAVIAAAANMASGTKWPVTRVGTTHSGRYVWKPEPAKAQPVAPATVTPHGPWNPAPSAPATYEPIQVSATQIPANGTTPELLSKVHVLDGGRYLFQGDDGSLYVVSSIVRINV